MPLVDCFGSCIEVGGTPVTVLTTTATSTTISVPHSPASLSHAGIISISVIGGLLLLGILGALAVILVRVQRRRPRLVRSRPGHHCYKYRSSHSRRYTRPRWLYADQRRYQFPFRDITGRLAGGLPRRGFPMGGASPWVGQGYSADEPALYGRGGGGVPLYDAGEPDLRRRGEDLADGYGDMYSPQFYGRGEGYVRPPDYPAAAAAAYGRERQPNARMGGRYDGPYGNAAEGMVPDAGIGPQPGRAGRRPGSEQRGDERGPDPPNREG